MNLRTSIRSVVLALVGGAFAFVFAGCATPGPRPTPEMTEEIRRLAELRDTCVQYAAWVAREFPSGSPDYKQCQQLYISASSAANAYIDSITFQIAAGSLVDKEAQTANFDSVITSADEFLSTARQKLGVRTTRGVFLLPTAVGMVDLGIRLVNLARERNEQQRQTIVQALVDKKWKRFDEILR